MSGVHLRVYHLKAIGNHDPNTGLVFRQLIMNSTMTNFPQFAPRLGVLAGIWSLRRANMQAKMVCRFGGQANAPDLESFMGLAPEHLLQGKALSLMRYNPFSDGPGPIQHFAA